VLDMGDRTTMEYVKDMGMGINLGNTFDCMGDWHSVGGTPQNVETAWGSPVITQEMIQGYADAGFGVMRLPVSWASLMDKDGNIDEPWLDRIDEVVGWILDTGMYCILNSHHDNWPERMTEDKEQGMKVYENVWTQVAKRFNKYGEKLMLESMNEVGFDDIWNQYAGTEGKQEAYDIFNEMNQKFVDIVRSSGKNNEKRHLLIAAYWTSIERACDEMYILPDDPAGRMAVSVHYYGPSTLCLLTKDAEWGKARTDWGSDADYEELNMWMDMMKENFVDKGIPVIVGEYGCFGSNKTKEVRQQWTTDVATAIHSRQMCPILWDTPGDEYQRIIKKFKNPEFIEKLIAIGEE
ncbi:MAG: glycoside hydrolase family 5 protein, partial [Huintestinicola sp.]